ncbi:GIY-YIG nuclease family protein [Paenibacillus pasadenensis]|uniref:LuxR family transcriptional regulator n=1 Tax=Paenibacillus pasadenensis TaxID=217090 RepID=A0A2N5N6H7_9BACL|nr:MULTISPECIES: GIY-YIG nuclease family protein [Paenibacillus]PLT45956.1 LuxR family transcriptional regulator [Paenibacillus pasadenensis]QGG56371.1 GIY-YIG nuclease family protein [Paenibacillus sp. B01]
MDKNRRKELQEQYKEMKTYLGVIRLTNRTNGKIFLAAYPNLKNKWTTLQAQLRMGRFANLDVQRDWNEHGEEAFEYAELERKEFDPVKMTDIKWELKLLLKPWLEKLQPYGDAGYNRLSRD